MSVGDCFKQIRYVILVSRATVLHMTWTLPVPVLCLVSHAVHKSLFLTCERLTVLLYMFYRRNVVAAATCNLQGM